MASPGKPASKDKTTGVVVFHKDESSVPDTASEGPAASSSFTFYSREYVREGDNCGTEVTEPQNTTHPVDSDPKHVVGKKYKKRGKDKRCGSSADVLALTVSMSELHLPTYEERSTLENPVVVPSAPPYEQSPGDVKHGEITSKTVQENELGKPKKNRRRRRSRKPSGAVGESLRVCPPIQPQPSQCSFSGNVDNTLQGDVSGESSLRMASLSVDVTIFKSVNEISSADQRNESTANTMGGLSAASTAHSLSAPICVKNVVSEQAILPPKPTRGKIKLNLSASSCCSTPAHPQLPESIDVSLHASPFLSGLPRPPPSLPPFPPPPPPHLSSPQTYSTVLPPIPSRPLPPRPSESLFSSEDHKMWPREEVSKDGFLRITVAGVSGDAPKEVFLEDGNLLYLKGTHPGDPDSWHFVNPQTNRGVLVNFPSLSQKSLASLNASIGMTTLFMRKSDVTDVADAMIDNEQDEQTPTEFSSVASVDLGRKGKGKYKTNHSQPQPQQDCVQQKQQQQKQQKDSVQQQQGLGQQQQQGEFYQEQVRQRQLSYEDEREWIQKHQPAAQQQQESRQVATLGKQESVASSHAEGCLNFRVASGVHREEADGAVGGSEAMAPPYTAAGSDQCQEDKRQDEDIEVSLYCANCLTGILPGEEDFVRCSRCRQIYYCDGRCRYEHWKGAHKSDCTASPRKSRRP